MDNFYFQELHKNILRDTIKSEELSEDSPKVIFVRDPIDRVVSAYVNKFEVK